MKSETPESGFSRVSEAALSLLQAGLSGDPEQPVGRSFAPKGDPAPRRGLGANRLRLAMVPRLFAEHPTKANFLFSAH